MKKYDRIRLIENIQRVAKEKNVKIGDMEEKAGTSTGFISRLKKDDQKGNFNVDLLCSVAEDLDCTLDYLVYAGEEGLTDNEKFMLEFIDKLTRDTNQYETEWSMMEPSIKDKYYIFEHPLFRKIDGCVEDPDGNFHYPQEMVYDSRFVDNASIAGNCFYTMLDDFHQAKVYVMKVSEYVDMFKNNEIIEIYIIEKNGTIRTVACSKFACDEVKAAIENLYKSISDARSHLTVDSRVKSIIGEYMRK